MTRFERKNLIWDFIMFVALCTVALGVSWVAEQSDTWRLGIVIVLFVLTVGSVIAMQIQLRRKRRS